MKKRFFPHAIVIGLMLAVSGTIFFFTLKHKELPQSTNKVVETPLMEKIGSTRVVPVKEMKEKEASQSFPEKIDSESQPSLREGTEESSPEIEEREKKSAEQIYRERLRRDPEYQALRKKKRQLAKKEDELIAMYSTMTDYAMDVRDELSSEHYQAQMDFIREVAQRGEDIDNVEIPEELTDEALEKRQEEAVGDILLDSKALSAEVEKIQKQKRELTYRSWEIVNRIRAELGLPPHPRSPQATGSK